MIGFLGFPIARSALLASCCLPVAPAVPAVSRADALVASLPPPAIVRPAEHALLKPGAFRPCTGAERRAILADLVRSGRMTREQALAAIVFIPWVAGGSSFEAFSTDYTATGGQTIAIPAGAVAVTIEVIAAGAGGNSGNNGGGGGGGGYAKRNTYSVAGLTGIYIYVPPSVAASTSGAAAYARENASGGTVICSANGGGPGSGASAGSGGAGTVGDVLHTGGNGDIYGTGGGGGGAAGPTSNGSPGYHSIGGDGGGTPAGKGGDWGGNPGANYGGGGNGYNTGTGGAGAQGWVKLSWT